LQIPLKEGLGGEREGDFTDNFILFKFLWVKTSLPLRFWDKWKFVKLGLSEPAPTSAPSKKSRSGISWMGWSCPPVPLRGQFFWSAVFFFSWDFFFGSSLFFSWAHFGFFFWAATLTTIWSRVGNSYLALQPTSLPALPTTSPSTSLILLKLLSIANAPNLVWARFRAAQGLELIRGETRGGAPRGVLLVQGVEHCRHKEQSAIARSLELQGKLGSKPLFSLHFCFHFFRALEVKATMTRSLAHHCHFSSLLELQRWGPWWRWAKFVIVMDLFSRASKTMTMTNWARHCLGSFFPNLQS
jgi:hypothetical protein